MRKLVIYLIATLSLILLTTPIYAEDTSVSDLVGTTNSTSSTSENADTAKSNNSLNLSYATQTDNPSSTITFTDPSTDSDGVQLEIDSKGFVDITSPYTFSALSIGKHTLEFKYVDEDGTTQIYDTSITIVPRVPIFNSPVISSDKITISGTGLANSELLISISNGENVISKETTITAEGEWSIEMDRTLFDQDVYSVVAYIRRYGYASSFSETMKFTLNSNGSYYNDSSSTFSFKNITLDSVMSMLDQNKYYIITALLSIGIGIGLGILFVHKKKIVAEERFTQRVEKEFKKAEPKAQGVTLREKLMGNVPELPKTEKAPEPEEKVVNKIDFLKDFKKFDPDDEKGEEVKSKVEVSLTSKKENS